MVDDGLQLHKLDFLRLQHLRMQVVLRSREYFLFCMMESGINYLSIYISMDEFAHSLLDRHGWHTFPLPILYSSTSCH